MTIFNISIKEMSLFITTTTNILFLSHLSMKQNMPLPARQLSAPSIPMGRKSMLNLSQTLWQRRQAKAQWVTNTSCLEFNLSKFIYLFNWTSWRLSWSARTGCRWWGMTLDRHSSWQSSLLRPIISPWSYRPTACQIAPAKSIWPVTVEPTGSQFSFFLVNPKGFIVRLIARKNL